MSKQDIVHCGLVWLMVGGSAPMNYADPTLAIGLLLMGMGIGAFLTREFYRRNLHAIVDQEIEERCRCGSYRANPASRRPIQPIAHHALRLQGGHSPERAN